MLTRTLTTTTAVAVFWIAMTTPLSVRDAVAAPNSGELSNPSIFLRLTGENQGALPGGSTDSRCIDCIEIIGFDHELISPRDAASGLPTGRRQHTPLALTKRIDKSTPLLYNALVTNENVIELQVLFFRDREAMPYYTVSLVNASVADIQTEKSPAIDGPPREAVAFTYQRIIWTWEDGGITAEDDWETPTA